LPKIVTIYALNISNSKVRALTAEKTIEYTVKIKNENGDEEIAVTSLRAIPGFTEFEESSFTSAFHKLEGTILEANKDDVNVKVTE
jgi:hypothetical protein